MFEKAWKFFSSLKPAGFIFTALILSTLIGSFIIQTPNAQEGQIERAYSPDTVQLFEFFGFFDLFHSPWFVLLIALLAVNVICASIAMWPRHVKLSGKIDPDLPEETLRHQPFFHEMTLPEELVPASIKAGVLARITARFKAPAILHVGGKTRYFVNRMRYGYFGVYVVHAGLIIIMIGGIIGSLGGFEGQMSLMEGESSSRVYVKNARRRNHLLDFTVKCHDIRIETYENGSPKDYFSDLEILTAQGESVLRKTVQVNEPLSYGGVNFYQANYGKKKVGERVAYRLSLAQDGGVIAGAIELTEDAELALPDSLGVIRFTHYSDNPVMPFDTGPVALGETLRLILVKDGKEEAVTLFKDYPDIDAMLRPLAPFHFAFLGRDEDFELREVTGLQVAKDLGAPVVFTGCAVLVAGIIWTFFTSHQKLWAVVDGRRILLAGRTYRNQDAFRQRFADLVGDIGRGMPLQGTSGNPVFWNIPKLPRCKAPANPQSERTQCT